MALLLLSFHLSLSSSSWSRIKDLWVPRAQESGEWKTKTTFFDHLYCNLSPLAKVSSWIAPCPLQLGVASRTKFSYTISNKHWTYQEASLDL
jgi:hypothetical protein